MWSPGTMRFANVCLAGMEWLLSAGATDRPKQVARKVELVQSFDEWLIPPQLRSPPRRDGLPGPLGKPKAIYPDAPL